MDTPDNLQSLMSDHDHVITEIAASMSELKHCWEAVPEIEHFDLAPAEGAYVRCALTARSGVDLRPQIFTLARDRGWAMRELTRSRISLEEIFVRVTRADKEEDV